VDGVCVCNSAIYSGPACDLEISEVNVIPNTTWPSVLLQPTFSTTFFDISVMQLIEIDQHNNTVLSYDLSGGGFSCTQNFSENGTVWTYYSDLPNRARAEISYTLFNTSTIVNFAGESQKITPQLLKITFLISDWSFQNIRNTFSIILTATPASLERVAPKVISQLNRKGAITWLGVEVGRLVLFAQFIPYSVLDGKIAPLGVTCMNSGGNQQIMVLSSPSFTHKLDVDPNFSVLVSPQSYPPNRQVIIGVVVSVVGGIILVATISYFIYPRIHVWWILNKTRKSRQK